MTNYFSLLNIWAVLVSAAAYWIIGSIWFSALFSAAWEKELLKHVLPIKEPTKKELITKIIMNYIYNLVAALAACWFVKAMGIHTFREAICAGLIAGVGFSTMSFAIAYQWESRSKKLLLIDAGHHVIGVTACFIILTLWQ